MSGWTAGAIQKQVSQHPVGSVVAYAAMSFAALAMATPTGAAVSLAGGVVSGLLTAVPLALANKKGDWKKTKIASAAVIGAIFPFAGVALATYQGFKLSRLQARRDKTETATAPRGPRA